MVGNKIIMAFKPTLGIEISNLLFEPIAKTEQKNGAIITPNITLLRSMCLFFREK